MFRTYSKQLLRFNIFSGECRFLLFAKISGNRLFHDEFSNPEPLEKRNRCALENKYNIFKDEDSLEIFDVEEEKQRINAEDLTKFQHNLNYNMDINTLKRGVSGVFDIEDLVSLLKQETAENIVVCSVPQSIKYVDYICIVTARSFRHMRAIAEFVRKIYKLKRNKGDVLPRIEGESSQDWMALDLGNIALHIFSAKARKIYDLESLWSVGPDYDRECNKPEDPLIELFHQHSVYLNDLIKEPIGTDETISK